MFYLSNVNDFKLFPKLSLLTTKEGKQLFVFITKMSFKIYDLKTLKEKGFVLV
jgi:hypothetical protein